MSSALTRRALRIATALTDAAARGDHAAIRRMLARLDGVPTDGPGDLGDSVVRMAAGHFAVTVDDLRSPRQDREVLVARQVACYAGHLLGLSYTHIGRAVGRRHHTTVMNAVTRVGEAPRLRGAAETIAERLGWDRGAVA